ncbi:hypothetical protein ACS0TY_034212 [Phlomoides rotata]
MDKTRRAWTPVEEGVLVELMKELVTKGWKTENGFKPGYLLKLEFEMLKKIPGTDLRANPHITSRITIWKKFHGSLQMMLNGNSGVGFNPTTGLLDYHDDCWARIVKLDLSGNQKDLYGLVEAQELVDPRVVEVMLATGLGANAFRGTLPGRLVVLSMT